MTRFSLILPILIACGVVTPAAGPPQKANSAQLDGVLKKMDEVSASFRMTQADFEWDRYEKVIDEVDDVETGTIYYRRRGTDIEMMAEVKKAGASRDELKPEAKYVLYNEGKIQMFQPKANQVTVWDLGKSAADFKSYLALGFGGSGQDLQKAFDVTYQGTETIDGVSTAKLQLVPKSEKVRNTYNQILLWIDLDKGVSLQQKFFSPQGDFRLCKYSSVQVNGKKIPDEVFKLKTNDKTQTISPGG